ncbi:MAG: patatin-like phospholipase family protein, partial [Myxococcaceae bacterium]
MLGVTLIAILTFAAPDGGAAEAPLDGGSRDPATRFIEAAQELDRADGGVASGSKVDEDALLQATLHHQKLASAVSTDLPPVSELSQLHPLRLTADDAFSTLQRRVAEYRKKLATAQQVNDALQALLDADSRLTWGIDQALRNLTAKVQPTAIVVSGGVSLGAYQAGLLHYYTQYLLQHRQAVGKLAPDLLDEPVTATGASAGSINAFLSAITICRKPVTRPEDSLFWRVWMPVGFDGLIDLDDVTTYSLLSRKPLDRAVELVGQSWSDDGWRPDPCRINLGFTVTREVPRAIPLNKTVGSDTGSVKLPIQTERVVIVMEGEGGGSPAVRSWVPPDDDSEREFFTDFNVKSPARGALPESLVNILKASSAFPVAFPPVLLGQDGGSSYNYFLDGGVFDNNPVRLATMLLERSRPGRSANLGIAQSRLKRELPWRLLYVEPDATPWQDQLVAEARRRDSFASMYSQLVSSLVGTARRAELLSTIEHEHSLRDRIDVPLRGWPITGSFLLNFFAFLEEDFRRFDFYSGMADAWEFLHAGDDAEQRLGLSEVQVDSREFECVLAFRKTDGKQQALEVPSCHGYLDGAQDKRRAKNLLALLNTSARVRDAIRTCIAEKNCEQGMEFNVLSRELAENGYEFTDPRFGAQTVIASVRERLHPLVTEFAQKQPFSDRAAVTLIGKAALDSLYVRPSAWYVGIGMLSRSGGELEYSHRLVGPWRPLTFGARLMRVQSRFLEANGSKAEERYSVTGEL